MQVGIVGYGHVGQAMHHLFKDAVVYDEPRQIGTKAEINQCGCVFVCVPTPPRENGSCDVSIVEDVLAWIMSELIVLRSTVPVGFTDRMMRESGKNIIFQPEYYGETAAHPLARLEERMWLTFGGRKQDVSKAVQVYQTVYSADVRIYVTDAKTAELAKYMENCFLAMKVTFCNEMFDAAQAFGINYDELREVWLADPRIGRSHTFVFPQNRGFGGSCLPKDLDAFLYQSKEKNLDVTLMESVKGKNKRLRDAGNIK